MDISQCVLNPLITYTKQGGEVNKIIYSLPLRNKPSRSTKLYFQCLHWTLISEITEEKKETPLAQTIIGSVESLWFLGLCTETIGCFNQAVHQTFLTLLKAEREFAYTCMHVCVHSCIWEWECSCMSCVSVFVREKESLEDWQLQQSLHAGLNARLARSGSGSSGCLLPFGTQWLEYPLLY